MSCHDCHKKIDDGACYVMLLHHSFHWVCFIALVRQAHPDLPDNPRLEMKHAV